MRAVVFSGTTEGRVFSKQLAALGAEVLVSVATPLGQEEQGSTPGVTVRCGRLLPDEMAALLGDAALCIDATHPYAVEATKNIKAAAEKAGVGYLRLLRPASPLPENCLVFESAKQAAAALAAKEGNLLLATGAKELAQFAAIPPARLSPRVLPTLESIAACEAANIPHRNIIAMQGPFSFALNQAMMELGATVCGPNTAPRCDDCPVSGLCLGRQRGTAETLPVKKAKKERRVEEKTVLLLMRDRKIALRKRPKTGLLEGLWEFPNVEGDLDETAAGAAVEAMGLSVIDWQSRLTAKHIFTHVEWRMTGYALTVRGDGPAELEWVDAAGLAARSVPSAFARYYEEAKRELEMK